MKHKAFDINLIAKELATEEKENKTMALTRKLLKTMGIEDEKIDQIIEAHSETVTGLTTERDTFKANNEKLATVQKELDKTKKEYEKLSKDPDKYSALEKEFNDYKTGIETTKTKASKTKALNELLKESKANDKAISLLAKTINLDNIELGEDGKIKDSENVIAPIKADYADFFTTEEAGGAEAGNPAPTNGEADSFASGFAKA